MGLMYAREMDSKLGCRRVNTGFAEKVTEGRLDFSEEKALDSTRGYKGPPGRRSRGSVLQLEGTAAAKA